MQYVSTRGQAPRLEFRDVILAGLARDGGLYVPCEWPQLSPHDIAALAGRPYHEAAFAVLRPYVGGQLPDAELRRMLADAYSGFRHPAVAPLVQLDSDRFVLELFHGPTLAFKDVAMQLLGRVMDRVLVENGRRATIVVATSGDTGGAAIEAFRGCESIDMYVLYPHGRVSPVQRRQMTTIEAGNVHALAIDGSFDDCQARVKDMFNHAGFRDRVGLSAVNSINWGRIMAQIVYYFTSAVALGSPYRPVSFAVPTGNFGDIFAGFAAARMGLPIEQLVIATNRNDILHRTVQTGEYQVHDVEPTTSPSMDIQVSSNFERLLYEAGDRDDGMVRALMGQLAQSGRFTVPAGILEAIRAEFGSGSADEDVVAATIATTCKETGYVLDPHTAVAHAVAADHRGGGVPMVTLATAHPAKFPDAVEAACGVRPGLPAWLGDLMQRRERITRLPNDLAAIEAFIGDTVQGGGGGI